MPTNILIKFNFSPSILYTYNLYAISMCQFAYDIVAYWWGFSNIAGIHNDLFDIHGGAGNRGISFEGEVWGKVECPDRNRNVFVFTIFTVYYLVSWDLVWYHYSGIHKETYYYDKQPNKTKIDLYSSWYSSFHLLWVL